MRVVDYDENIADKFNHQIENIIKNNINKKIILVGIESGGVPLAKSAFRYLEERGHQVSIGSLKCQRPSSKIKKGNYLKEKMTSTFLMFLPKSLKNTLRIIEHRILSKRPEVNRVITNENIPVDMNDDNFIILIDDAVDSGYSLKHVFNFILSKYNVIPKTCVVTSTQVNPVIKADISILNNVLVRFPWSLDAK